MIYGSKFVHVWSPTAKNESSINCYLHSYQFLALLRDMLYYFGLTALVFRLLPLKLSSWTSSSSGRRPTLLSDNIVKSCETHGPVSRSEYLLEQNESAKYKKFFIETHGCQMNLADSDIVRSVLLTAGYMFFANLPHVIACKFNL